LALHRDRAAPVSRGVEGDPFEGDLLENVLDALASPHEERNTPYPLALDWRAVEDARQLQTAAALNNVFV